MNNKQLKENELALLAEQKEIGKAIRKMRLSMGLTIEQMALRANVSASQLGITETGRTPITEKMFIALYREMPLPRTDIINFLEKRKRFLSMKHSKPVELKRDSIPYLLHKKRMELNLSVEDVTKQLGIKPYVIERLESGMKSLNKYYYEKLSTIYQLDEPVFYIYSNRFLFRDIKKKLRQRGWGIEHLVSILGVSEIHLRQMLVHRQKQMSEEILFQLDDLLDIIPKQDVEGA